MRNGPLRILHVVVHLDHGGLERLVVDITRRLDRQRFESHVLALLFAGHNARSLDADTTLHLAPPLPRRTMLYPRGLIRQIGAIAPDVVHVHSGAWYKGGLAARRAGVSRVIFTDHGRPSPDRLPGRLVDRLAARRADTVVAVSRALAEHLAAKVVGRGTPITLVPNGVDTACFAPGPPPKGLMAELGLPSGVPVVGSLGRLDPIKGYDVMVEAFHRLRRSWPETAGPAPVLLIAGEGPERGPLERLVRSRGLEDVVRLPGWRDDVAGILRTLTLFVLSSRSEGTSISLLEAMSCGVCPVVNDVGGNEAVLGPELGHRLVRGRDAATLADAWQAALLDPTRRRADAAAARSRVEATFSLAAMVERYAALYAGSQIPPRPEKPRVTPPAVRAATKVVPVPLRTCLLRARNTPPGPVASARRNAPPSLPFPRRRAAEGPQNSTTLPLLYTPGRP